MLQARSRVCIYRRYGKRLTDVILSFSGLVLLAPLFLLIAIWVKLDSKGPVLFKQKRVGRNKTYFNILKFRSMRMDAPRDMPTHLLSNPHAHITRSGRFLRKTSLDELPQLWNIFIGQMSVIGPRPALWNQEDLIFARDKYGANNVRPGLTGWAQINGRDELEIEMKAERDGEYVRNVTMKMDVSCIFMTISGVLLRKGFIEGGPNLLKEHKSTRSQEVVAEK